MKLNPEALVVSSFQTSTLVVPGVADMTDPTPLTMCYYCPPPRPTPSGAFA